MDGWNGWWVEPRQTAFRRPGEPDPRPVTPGQTLDAARRPRSRAPQGPLPDRKRPRARRHRGLLGSRTTRGRRNGRSRHPPTIGQPRNRADPCSTSGTLKLRTHFSGRDLPGELHKSLSPETRHSWKEPTASPCGRQRSGDPTPHLFGRPRTIAPCPVATRSAPSRPPAHPRPSPPNAGAGDAGYPRHSGKSGTHR